MTWQAWLTLAMVALTLYALARELIAPALAVLGAVVVLLVAGVLTPAEAFSGFGNPAPITVAALYVVARAVEKTGGLQSIVAAALGGGKGKERVSLLRLLLPAAGASAFLNNTPIVAMLIGPVTEWADRAGKSPSRYLMPVAYAVTLGGIATTIGTSTNIVVSGLLERAGQAPLRLFEMTPVGLPVAIGGVFLIVLLAPVLLPERRPARAMLDEGGREFAAHMVVVPNGPLDGKAVEAGGLRHLQGVYLVQVSRSGQVIAPVEPTFVLQGGDQLAFVGRADLVLDLQAQRGLVSAERPHIESAEGDRQSFFEVVIGPASPLVGKTLVEVGFRARYQAAVLAIHRSGHRLSAKLGTVELHVGDTLLLLADGAFRDRWRDRSDFLVVSRVGGKMPVATKKAPLVWALALGVVVVAGAGILPILQASLVAAMALVLFKVLTPGEARGAVDLDVVLLVAASFGLGIAIEKTGLAAMIANALVQTFGGMGRAGALLGVVLATMAVTEVVTNNAAAVVLFPIAMAAAGQVGADPRSFAIAVAMAASASFLTPIGYQCNTMVYGPGGYRFWDYGRLGLPITIWSSLGIVGFTALLAWL